MLNQEEYLLVTNRWAAPRLHQQHLHCATRAVGISKVVVRPSLVWDRVAVATAAPPVSNHANLC